MVVQVCLDLAAVKSDGDGMEWISSGKSVSQAYKPTKRKIWAKNRESVWPLGFAKGALGGGKNAVWTNQHAPWLVGTGKGKPGSTSIKCG